jgi:hypothetical protein
MLGDDKNFSLKVVCLVDFDKVSVVDLKKRNVDFRLLPRCGLEGYHRSHSRSAIVGN